MATGSNRFLQYVKQATPRELPVSPIFTRLRNTGGGGIANNRTSITSNEIRSDRQIIETRLGQNQPDVTVPYELSYDSFDELIQGAMGSAWVGGEVISVTGVDVSTAGVYSLTGSDTWADYDVSVGEYVYANSTGNANTIGYVGAISGSDLTIYDIDTEAALTTSAESDVAVSLVTGHYGDQAVTGIDVDGSANTITRAAGSWATTGVEVGDKIFFSGFSEAGNNGWLEVSDVTATVLTIRDDVTLTTEISATVSFVTSTGFITVGTDLDYFAIEEGFEDVTTGDDIDGGSVTAGVFHHILGCYVASWNLNIQPDAILTGEFGFQGLIYSGFKNATAASSVADSNIANVFDSFTGNLRIPSATEIQSVITGLNFTLDNGLTRRYALMDKNAISIGDGRSNVTGTLNAYFENATVANLFEKEEELEASIRSEDLAGNSYTFGWPRIKLTSESRDVSESDVTETLNFQALGGLSSDKKKTMYVLRQPVVA